MRKLVGAVVLLLVLTGCNTGDSDPDVAAAEELGALVDPGLGSGMKAVDGATGPMTTELAAKATAVRAAALGPWLETHGFQGGYSRVWTSDHRPIEREVLTALVFHFFSERNAQDFIDFSIDKIATSATYVAFTDPTVPRSRGFLLTSRVARTTKFCAGEYFPVGRDAHLVTRCAPYPMNPQLITPTAGRQLVHAVTAGAK